MPDEPPITGQEWVNPARRYKWFRPRQAARGTINLASVSNGSNCGLLNNSTGAQLLVVRDFQAQSYDSYTQLAFGYVQGNPGSAAGVIQPYMPTGAAPPGLLWTYDNATPGISLDYFTVQSFTNARAAAFWPHDFPFAVLEPGWSLAVQVSAGGTIDTTQLLLSVIWEAVTVDELDFLY